MAKNPFNNASADPLAGSTGQGGAWGGAGAAAGGFGAVGAAAGGSPYEVDEYDVVDIGAPGATAKPSVQAKTPAKIGTGFLANLTGKNPEKREKALEVKENELRQREADIAAREAQVRGATAGADLVKNWPACFPVVHHDIAADIPAEKRSIQRKGFFIFLLTILALVFNLVAILVGVITKASGGNTIGVIIFAILYVLLGVPGAWILWYNRLYQAMKRDGAFSFAAFFCSFMFHIGWCAWCAVAPGLNGNQYSFAGLIPALDFLSAKENIAFIFFLTGFCLWTVVGALSFFYLLAVYSSFRSGGGVERVQYQATQMAGQAAVQQATRR